MEISGRDLAGYADLLRTRLGELMHRGQPEDYPHTVAATLRLSYDRIGSYHAAAAGLLRICACLAADDIPIDLLRGDSNELPNALRDALADELEFDRTIASLRRYALLKRHGDGLRIHRLVQVVIRESLAPDQRRAYLATVIRMLRAGFPDEVQWEFDKWPLCRRLLAHVVVVDQLAAGQEVEQRAVGWLLDRAARYLWARGELALAESLHRRALTIRERVLGPDNIDTAESLSDLGWVLRDEGDALSARPLLERALSIREQTLGGNHLATAETLDNLGQALWALTEMREARLLLERALAIRNTVLGSNHYRTAESLNNLGALLLDSGEVDTARRYLEYSQVVYRRVLGSDHPATATALPNLANAYREQGDVVTARKLHEQALATTERTLGPGHPYVAWTLHQLARVMLTQGDQPRARALLERAVAAFDRSLGMRHPRTMMCRGLLAQIDDQLEAR